MSVLRSGDGILMTFTLTRRVPKCWFWILGRGLKDKSHIATSWPNECNKMTVKPRQDHQPLTCRNIIQDVLVAD